MNANPFKEDKNNSEWINDCRKDSMFDMIFPLVKEKEGV